MPTALMIMSSLTKAIMAEHMLRQRATGWMTTMHDMLLALTKACDINEQITLVEDICRLIILEMRTQEYTNGQSDYLMDHIPEIMKGIESTEIKNHGINLVF